MYKCVKRTAFLAVWLAVPSLTYAADLFSPPPFIQPEPLAPSSSWTGFYIGGGIGIQKMTSDLDIKSKNKSEAGDYHDCRRPYIGNISGNNQFINFQDDAGAKFNSALDCIANNNKLIDDNPNFKHFKDSNFNFSDDKEVNSDWEAFGTAMIGYDYQISRRLIIGAFANFDFGSTKTKFGQAYTGIPDGTYYTGTKANPNSVYAGQISDELLQDVTVSGDFESDYSFTIGGRLGYLFANQKTLGYILAGYSRTSIDGHLNYGIDGVAGNFNNVHSYDSVPISASQKISEDINGFTIGAGAEHKLNDNWSARLEYRYTWYENIEASFSEFAFSNDSKILPIDGQTTWARSTQTDTTVDIDPSVHSIRAVLSYKFGNKRSYIPPLK
ncbi:MAG: outer membrane beta-barrel protein [Pseudomonadota bacterium]